MPRAKVNFEVIAESHLVAEAVLTLETQAVAAKVDINIRQFGQPDHFLIVGEASGDAPNVEKFRETVLIWQLECAQLYR
jgi:hypothetical protein